MLVYLFHCEAVERVSFSQSVTIKSPAFVFVPAVVFVVAYTTVQSNPPNLSVMALPNLDCMVLKSSALSCVLVLPEIVVSVVAPLAVPVTTLVEEFTLDFAVAKSEVASVEEPAAVANLPYS